ncbi:MAG: molybdenum cofactor guanylyltransferase [Candidatus Eremiobacteraeota bacterium]|nr:molybdenum cofactor guanylyltransferase [Candidatus Eremiobacteraeota bacterium]MBV8280596.1 molybdenum cofactor guanylyltransferase [Candidatus Eremiobacteraeota bacterium]
MSDGDRVTVVLLAGGPATRLPGKLGLDVEGEPMLVRSLRRLTALGWPCVVSVRAPLEPPVAAVFEGSTVAYDRLADGGPLGGLHSALAHVRTPLFFAAAADVPNLSAQFAARLLAMYDAVTPKPDAVLPTWRDRRVEPLAALYDRAAFERGAARALQSGLRKVTAALEGADVVPYLIGQEDEALLANVNTQADYERVRAGAS